MDLFGSNPFPFKFERNKCLIPYYNKGGRIRIEKLAIDYGLTDRPRPLRA